VILEHAKKAMDRSVKRHIEWLRRDAL
jgi:hypothetical protein